MTEWDSIHISETQIRPTRNIALRGCVHPTLVLYRDREILGLHVGSLNLNNYLS